MTKLPRRGLRPRHQEGAHRRHRGQQARHPGRRRRRHQLRPRRHPVRDPRQRRRHPLPARLMCRIIADAVEEGRFIAARRAGGGHRGPAAADAHRRGRGSQSPPSRPRPAARPRPPRRRARGAPRRTPGGSRRPEPRRRPSRSRKTPSLRRSDRRETTRTPAPSRDTAATQKQRGVLSHGQFTAKDVQALRQATGAGMMDAKRALEANDGDMEAAKQWLREKGLADSRPSAPSARTPRAPSHWSIDGNVGADRRAEVRDRLRREVASTFKALVQRPRATLVVGRRRRRRASAPRTQSTTSRSR